jgi:hypothetical protein
MARRVGEDIFFGSLGGASQVTVIDMGPKGEDASEVGKS